MGDIKGKVRYVDKDQRKIGRTWKPAGTAHERDGRKSPETPGTAGKGTGSRGKKSPFAGTAGGRPGKTAGRIRKRDHQSAKQQRAPRDDGTDHGADPGQTEQAGTDRERTAGPGTGCGERGKGRRPFRPCFIFAQRFLYDHRLF